jgi:hypothetical protein
MGRTPEMIQADQNLLSLKQSAAQEKMNLEALMANKVEKVASTTLAPKVVGMSPVDRYDKSQGAAKEFRDIISNEQKNLDSNKQTLNLVDGARKNPANTGPLIINYIRSVAGEKGTLSEGDVQRLKLNPSWVGKAIDYFSTGFEGTLSNESLNNLETVVKNNINIAENAIRAKGVKYGERMARLGLDPVDIFDEHLPTIYGKKEDKKPSQVLGGIGKKRTK